MTAYFFPDNTALINFHIIERWDLLAATVDGLGQWCGSVARECQNSTASGYAGMYESAASVFGDPIYPEPAEHVDTRVVRQNLADPTDDWPTKHLGEAETIAIAVSRFHGSRFITDDLGARDAAVAAGIRCYGTGDLLVVAERHLSLVTTSQRSALESRLKSARRTIRYYCFNP